MKKYMLTIALALIICLLLIPATTFGADYVEVIPPQYYFSDSFSEGLAGVMVLDKGWGFIDKTGKMVIEPQYKSAPEKSYSVKFSEGLAAVWTGYHQGGYIDQTGKVVIPFKYTDLGHFYEGMAWVMIDYDWNPMDVNTSSNPKYGVIDKSGNEVVPVKYDAATDFSEGMAAVGIGNYQTGYKWGFIDKTGEEIIPPIYDDVNWEFFTGLKQAGFYEGLAAVQLNGKWGFIDKTGEVVIPFIYDKATRFQEGLAVVTVGVPTQNNLYPRMF